MSENMKIDTAAIESAAGTLDSLNNQLMQKLADSDAVVQSLNNSWSGEAAEATLNAYSAFKQKYSQHYHDVLNQYSNFLKNVAAQNYQQTESAATRNADNIGQSSLFNFEKPI